MLHPARFTHKNEVRNRGSVRQHMNEVRGAKRRKILMITRNLPPLVGGMERFNERVIVQLGKGFDVAVCGPAGCEKFLPMSIPVADSPVRPLPLFLVRSALSSLRMAGKFRPDVVIAGSGLTAPLALAVARVRKVPALVFLYGLDLVVPSFAYQKLWLSAIRRCDGYLPISKHTRSLAVEKGLDPAKMEIVNPGVDQVPEHAMDDSSFRERHDLGKRPILLSVGRLTRRKGLVEFVNKCMPEIVKRHPDVVLVVIGGEPADALAGNRGGVSNEVHAVAKSLAIERNIRLLGSVSDEIVRSAYRASQVHVFPIRDIPGDVEGFGIVALEAAISGVPTVAFSVGGVPDAVAPGISGALVAPADYPAFSAAVMGYLETVNAQGAKQRADCITFARAFEWDCIGIRLRAAISRLAEI